MHQAQTTNISHQVVGQHHTGTHAEQAQDQLVPDEGRALDHTHARQQQQNQIHPWNATLTKNLVDAVNAAFSEGSEMDVVINKYNVKLLRRDFRTLDGLTWLNDERAWNIQARERESVDPKR